LGQLPKISFLYFKNSPGKGGFGEPTHNPPRVSCGGFLYLVYFFLVLFFFLGFLLGIFFSPFFVRGFLFFLGFGCSPFSRRDFLRAGGGIRGHVRGAFFLFSFFYLFWGGKFLLFFKLVHFFFLGGYSCNSWVTGVGPPDFFFFFAPSSPPFFSGSPHKGMFYLWGCLWGWGGGCVRYPNPALGFLFPQTKKSPKMAKNR